jgi:hypothetical protein
MEFMWTPALEGMTESQIIIFNRLITANFRAAERGAQIDLKALYPVSRQASLMLMDQKGNWDCNEVMRTWEAAVNFMKNTSEHRLNH